MSIVSASADSMELMSVEEGLELVAKIERIYGEDAMDITVTHPAVVEMSFLEFKELLEYARNHIKYENLNNVSITINGYPVLDEYFFDASELSLHMPSKSVSYYKDEDGKRTERTIH